MPLVTERKNFFHTIYSGANREENCYIITSTHPKSTKKTTFDGVDTVYDTVYAVKGPAVGTFLVELYY